MRTTSVYTGAFAIPLTTMSSPRFAFKHFMLICRWAALLLSSTASLQSFAAASFEEWSEAFAAKWVRETPEFSTTAQYFSGSEQAAIDRALTPQTKEQRGRMHALARAGLTQLSAYENATLSPKQRTEAATLRWSLERSIAAEPFDDYSFLFNQLFGPQVRFVSFMTQTHPLRRPADVETYLARLSAIDVRLDEALVRGRAAAARGLLPPSFIVERSRAQVQTFLGQPPKQNDLVAALEKRTERLEGLSPKRRQQAIDQAVTTVREKIVPAYRRVLEFLDEIAPRTTVDAGLWRLPNGDAAYAQALAFYTTTSLSADEIHAIGLREVARIESEMDAVLTKIGRTQGTVRERMTALRTELQRPAEPDPRAGLIARFAEYVADNQRRSQALFNLQPKAPVEVKREPLLTEKTAAAHYSLPAPDGSLPGVFWVPLPGPTFDIAAMRSLAVHEAVPGHHFQLAIQQETTDLPRWRQRRVFGGGSAHAEGWALYAERLAIENGWYADDPIALLGALSSQLFRARRLVVDTGLHAKRWTREQAIAYGIGAQEVERYISNPGQACAYMIGMLRILSLRDEAKQALGPKFELKAFHDVVLTTGSVPLDVLSDVIRRWISNQKS